MVHTRRSNSYNAFRPPAKQRFEPCSPWRAPGKNRLALCTALKRARRPYLAPAAVSRDATAPAAATRHRCGPAIAPHTNVSPRAPPRRRKVPRRSESGTEDAHDLPAMRQGLSTCRRRCAPRAATRRQDAPLNWSESARRRSTGRMRHMRHMPRRFRTHPRARPRRRRSCRVGGAF